MKKEELDKLLAKFYNGETTEAEEELLRFYFTTGDVPPGYETESDVFSFYNNALDVPEPSGDFEKRILEGIDRAQGRERKGSYRRQVITFLSAAAAAVLFVISFFMLNRSVEPRDTYTDPKIAYNETMKILMSVSTQLNNGVKALEPVSRINEVAQRSFEPLKSLNKTSMMVDKNLRSLDYLDRAIEFTNTTDLKRINKK
ncbi:MAG TPA: hypothetical protein VJ963_04020 [Bacteroidales bacterium]|nr:hypothetical protein [Bacteroidales bacterium]